MKPGKSKILQALVEKKELTYTQLKQETTLSAPALSGYLKNLLQARIIEHMKNRKYRISRAFTPDAKLEEPEKTLQLSIAFLLNSASRIVQEKDSQKQSEMLEDFLTTGIESGAPLIVAGVLDYALDATDQQVKFEERLKEAVENWVLPFIEYLLLPARIVEHMKYGVSRRQKLLNLQDLYFRKVTGQKLFYFHTKK